MRTPGELPAEGDLGIEIGRMPGGLGGKPAGSGGRLLVVTMEVAGAAAEGGEGAASSWAA